ncbi:hypothetical protein NTJ56_02570 [Burkholderia contaminans]|nr:hypothetical protein [Burkholderia contaminans]MCA7920844.1 hypothetical protein [Burkholderia contaminans]UUX37726.1 hypothetical protein NTJ56_02570 [Burkholderia contaminans]
MTAWLEFPHRLSQVQPLAASGMPIGPVSSAIPWPIASISDQSANSSSRVSVCAVAREPLSNVDKIVELAMQATRSKRTEPPKLRRCLTSLF